jgi:hypothetical protein
MVASSCILNIHQCCLCLAATAPGLHPSPPFVRTGPTHFPSNLDQLHDMSSLAPYLASLSSAQHASQLQGPVIPPGLAEFLAASRPNPPLGNDFNPTMLGFMGMQSPQPHQGINIGLSATALPQLGNISTAILPNPSWGLNPAQLLAANSIFALTQQQAINSLLSAQQQQHQVISLNPGGMGQLQGLSSTIDPIFPPTSLPVDGRGRGTTGRHPIVIFMVSDNDSLSPYQCLIRKQIEAFEALQEDVETTAQGRNRRIVLGQVGIRCRHCAVLRPKERQRGAVYFPARLDGVYQAAQIIATTHLADRCQHLPPDTRQDLKKHREANKGSYASRVRGGGKQHWAQSMSSLGVYEDAQGLLRFHSSV